jgi:hypothetical protein
MTGAKMTVRRALAFRVFQLVAERRTIGWTTGDHEVGIIHWVAMNESGGKLNPNELRELARAGQQLGRITISERQAIDSYAAELDREGPQPWTCPRCMSSLQATTETCPMCATRRP